MTGYWLQLVTYFGINSILSLGFYFTFSAGQFSMAHVGFMGIAAYVSAIFTLKLGAPFAVAVVTAGLAAALAGIVVSLVLAQRLKGLFQAIGGLGFSLVVVVFFTNLTYTGGLFGLYGLPKATTTWLVFVVLVVAVCFLALFRRSRMGIEFAAVRDDQVAASAMGINLARTKVVAYAVGGLITGIGGALYAHYITILLPTDFGFGKIIDIILPPLLGGMATVYGTLLGAAVITFLPEAVRQLGIDTMLLWGLLLVILVILRPQGVIGRDTLPALGRKIRDVARGLGRKKTDADVT